MSEPIDAIYENGHIRILDDVDLHEGQKLKVIVVSDRDQLREALGDLVASWPDPSIVIEDEEALMAEIEEGFKGTPSLSELIIAERQEGP